MPEKYQDLKEALKHPEEDPDLYYIDHDDFWELEASHRGIRLSEFLSFFQKPGKSGK